uniref:Uncharacterized protein n=1 Tax=Romanomermis culicivorax TaxID=13658 RepID=A0A915J5S9_ROMCU
MYKLVKILEKELVSDEALEDITSKEEEEEKTPDNDISAEEEGTILDYDNDENKQYKIHTPHSSDEEEDFYKPVQIEGGVECPQFNFDKELLDYCHSNVQVLPQCCMKFRFLVWSTKQHG